MSRRGGLPRLSASLVLVFLALTSKGAETSRGKFSIRWTSTSVEVVGLDSSTPDKSSAWEKIFSIRVSGDPTVPAMLGTYSATPGHLEFRPAFPLEPGLKYTARFFPSQLDSKLPDPVVESEFSLPVRAASPATTVSAVYPTADVLPQNLLKFYLHFSGPMRRGQIYDHIHLLDEKDHPVELPFLEIDEELWNPAMDRLTLFIDPGRIKRGVRPLEEIGPALVEGHRFTLVIDSNWQDAQGRPLQYAFRKSFRAGPPDRRPLQARQWKISPPMSGSADPLRVQFEKPMDEALALRVIQVTDLSGRLLEGTSRLESEERIWTFRPAQAWRAGTYRLVVQATLEDLAGNNMDKAFEVDLFEKVDHAAAPAALKLSFTIK